MHCAHMCKMQLWSAADSGLQLLCFDTTDCMIERQDKLTFKSLLRETAAAECCLRLISASTNGLKQKLKNKHH